MRRIAGLLYLDPKVVGDLKEKTPEISLQVIKGGIPWHSPPLRKETMFASLLSGPKLSHWGPLVHFGADSIPLGPDMLIYMT